MLYADTEARDMDKQSPEHRKKMVAPIIMTIKAHKSDYVLGEKTGSVDLCV